MDAKGKTKGVDKADEFFLFFKSDTSFVEYLKY